jgi:hypothetical protein
MHALRNISLRFSTWNINDPITIDDIKKKKKKKTISSMKKTTKHPAPIEFYKALFCNEELLEIHPADAGKCLKL